ncbi:hypothetical protein [Photobacterium sp. J15]|uniref:hypothetical protein n=1 Tax=Photobacterium sp. J15 TaxID=265901 RepID=UPI0007E434BC|nr:hypothetical protein [Photobacterium sp. J15]
MLIKIMKDTGSTKTGYDTAFPVLSYLISPFQAYTPEQNAERKEWLECIRSYKNSDNIEERELYRLAQHELKAITRELRNTEPKELTPKAYDLVYELINLSPHVHKYTSLVLSHPADDNEKLLQNPEAMFEARQLMEEYAFAGIGEQDKASYWVEHTDKFRFEDHGVFPRIHPTTMKYFNPFPPGCERVLNLIRDYINLKYDLADPMYSARVKYFSAIGRYDSNRNFKQQLYDDLNKKLELGAFQTRWDVVNYLKSSEFEEKHG